MNHWIWAVSLVGILSTAVVCGTDMFFLTVGRPALKLASSSAGTEVMGFFHLFGDARMPIWGVSAILSNILLAVLSRSEQRWFYLAALLMLILFVIGYARLSKPINQIQTEAAKKGESLDNGRELQASWDRSLIIPCSAARWLPASPVPRIVSRFGLNVAGALPFERVRSLWAMGFEKSLVFSPAIRVSEALCLYREPVWSQAMGASDPPGFYEGDQCVSLTLCRDTFQYLKSRYAQPYWRTSRSSFAIDARCFERWAGTTPSCLTGSSWPPEAIFKWR